MGVKATFDGVTRVITITAVPVLDNGDMVVDIDVAADLYSDGKEDWLADGDLRKLLFPVRVVGGDTIPTGFLDGSFFLANDWSILPYDANHRLRIDGNFYRENGTTPFLSRAGRTIVIEQNLSAIVAATFADESAIVIAAGLAIEPYIYFDSVNGVPGQTDDVGTPTNPVDNVADALDLVASRGKSGVKIIEGTFALDRTVDNLVFVGAADPETSTLNPTSFSMTRCSIERCTLSGNANGQRMVAMSFVLDALTNFHGLFENCYLKNVTLDTGSDQVTFDSCRSLIPGSGAPEIDLNDRTGGVEFRGHIGGCNVLNLTSTLCDVSLDILSGHVLFDVTCTNANSVVLRGTGKTTNNSTIPVAKLDSLGFVGQQTVRNAMALGLGVNKTPESGSLDVKIDNTFASVWGAKK